MSTDKTQQFISRARSIHGDVYDYSKVEYISRTQAVTIICPKHGPFHQKPLYHVGPSASGCRQCYDDRRSYSETRFVSDATAKYAGRYTYGPYTGFRHNILVTCTIHHNTFTTTPLNHMLNNGGCMQCRSDDMRITKDEWVRRFTELYADQYDYSGVGETLKSSDKIPVKCTKPGHGIFYPQASAHASGKHKCPTCASISYVGGYSEEYFIHNPDKKLGRGTFYAIRLHIDNTITCIKIGITTQSIHDRFRYTMPYEYDVLQAIDGYLYDHHIHEQRLLTNHKQHQFIPPTRFPGWTECFTEDILPLL